MRKNWLEEKLYQRLKDKPADLDLDLAWKELEAKRYPKKDRRKSGFLWTFGGLILVLFLSSLFFSNKELLQNNKKLLVDNALIETSELTKKSKIEIFSEPVQTQITQTSKTDQKDQTANLKSTKEVITHNKTIASNNKKTTEKNTLSKQLENSRISLANQTIYQGNSQDNGIDNYAPVGVVSNTDNSTGIIASLNETNLSALQFAQISGLEINPFETDRSKLVLEEPDRPLHVVKHKKALRKRLGLAMTYGNMNGQLEGTRELSPVNSLRNELEKPLDRFDIGLSYDFFIKKNVYITTGLNFEQYTSSFTQIFQSSEVLSVTDTITIILDPEASPQYLFGEVDQRLKYQRSNYLKYRTISVPIGIGLNLPIAKTIDFNITSGLNIGFFTINNGEFIRYEQEFEELADLNDSYYKKSGILGGFAQIGFDKHLGNWSVGVGAKYNEDLTSRIDSNELNGTLDLNQKLSSVGLNFNIKRKF